MRNLQYRAWIIAASLVAVDAAAGELAELTAHLPVLGPPPQGDAQWVARSMRLNGLPMTIQSFKSHRNVDEIFNYYESESRVKGTAECTRTQKFDRRILGIKTSDYYISIEARATIAGSEGTITASPSFANGVRRITTRFPHPQAATIVNFQEYEDYGVNAEFISMQSSRSVALEASEFSSLLTRNGWTVLLDRSAEAAIGGRLLEMQRGPEQAQLTFQPNRSHAQTSITVIWKKS